MKKNSLIKNLAIISILFSLLACKCNCSCDKPKDTDPFTSFDPFDKDIAQRVEAYHNATTPNIANSKTGNPSIFIDFSSKNNNKNNNPTNIVELILS